MKKLFISSIAFLAIYFFSCHKDLISDTNTEVTIPQGPNIVSPVAHGLIGMIKDEQGNPIADATVYLYQQKTKTTVHGVYYFPEGKMDAYSSYIRVEKTGYFHNTHRYNPASSNLGFMNITLIKKQKTASFESTQSKVIEIANNKASISFEENSIKDKNGNIYNGKVNVYAYWIDPSREDLNDVMPGALMGRNANKEFVNIASFGMLICELEDESGNPLNIIASKPATLKMEIPSSIMNQAPASIPLWYFDEEIGWWKEESLATKNGNNYEGKVTHFSTWNCDIRLDKTLCIKGQVKYEDGSNAANVPIDFTIDNVPGHIGGYSELDGSFQTKIPANYKLKLTVRNPCGSIEYPAVIGPYTQDVMLADIIIKNTISLKGNVTDCNNQPVTKGYVIIDIKNIKQIVTSIDQNGNYNFNGLCFPLDSFQVSAYNYNDLTHSPWKILKSLTTNNIYNFRVCDTCSHKITIDIIQQPSCGNNDGTIKALITGGSGNYLTRWSNNKDDLIQRNLAAGFYCVSVTDLTTGCIAEKCITLTDVGMSVDSIIAKNIDCNTATGTITLYNVQGAAPIQMKVTTNNNKLVYQGILKNTLNNLDVGYYIIELLDANQCSIVHTSSIEDLCCKLQVKIETRTGTCAPFLITAEAGFGTAPYIYKWDSNLGNNQAVFSALIGTINYCVTVTDAKNCSSNTCSVITSGQSPPSMQFNQECINKGIKITPQNPLASLYNIEFRINNLINTTGIFSIIDVVKQNSMYSLISVSDQNPPFCSYNTEFRLCFYQASMFKREVIQPSCSNCADGGFNFDRLKVVSCDLDSTNYHFELYRENDNTNIINLSNVKQLSKGVYEFYYVNGAGCYLYGEKLELK